MANDFDAEKVVAAVNQLADMIGPNLDMFDDTAGSLTCSEAEAFADIFRAAGRTRVAELFIESHADRDEEGDLHYQANKGHLHVVEGYGR